jgi:hypothetical protein
MMASLRRWREGSTSNQLTYDLNPEPKPKPNPNPNPSTGSKDVSGIGWGKYCTMPAWKFRIKTMSLFNSTWKITVYKKIVEILPFPLFFIYSYYEINLWVINVYFIPQKIWETFIYDETVTNL